MCKRLRLQRTYIYMSVIYEPRGKAREYSPLALNLYLTCDHGCKYCYAPHSIQRSANDFFKSGPARNDLISKLERQLSKEDIDRQVLLSFIGDPYGPNADGCATTTEAIKVLMRYKVPTAILTKGGSRALKDINLLIKHKGYVTVGSSLTFSDPDKSIEWEPNAALPEDRLQMLTILHNNGIRTFASFEPVIDPEESLKAMQRSIDLDCIDLYKIGKLNGMPSIEKTINWSDFLQRALDLVRPTGKEIYIKDDLAAAAPGIRLTEEERNADLHTIKRPRREGCQTTLM